MKFITYLKNKNKNTWYQYELQAEFWYPKTEYKMAYLTKTRWGFILQWFWNYRVVIDTIETSRFNLTPKSNSKVYYVSTLTFYNKEATLIAKYS